MGAEMTSQKPIHRAASEIVGQLMAEYSGKTESAIAVLEPVMPGITHRALATGSYETLVDRLSVVAGWYIESLIEQSTEDSLTKALAAVKKLRTLVERGGSVDLEAVKN